VVADAAHSDVPKYLNAVDVLCAPSQTTERWREQFGRMLTEAFASGVAVVASRSGEIPHVVADAGVLLAERDLDGWTAAIDLLARDEGRRAELGRRGRARAESTFAWPVVARQHLDFFNELLG
jgi:glycosyltransferase involved in cell wall biosynthesis